MRISVYISRSLSRLTRELYTKAFNLMYSTVKCGVRKCICCCCGTDESVVRCRERKDHACNVHISAFRIFEIGQHC